MDIVIDLARATEILTGFFSQSADVILWKLVVYFGWIPLGITFLWGIKEVWINYIQEQWWSQQKFILLAIDVPRNNAQSPKAVENLFTYFLGAHGSINLVEIYWIGKFQLSFSFEIVSIEGYTQFLVHTPENFRDLVEASVYSQYPDAEITEVNDYTAEMPSKFPDEEWDVWGSEFIQVKPDVYPIKTYRDFEHVLGDPALTYRDPINALMSLCSSLGRGEQLWYQIVCKPVDFSWTDKGDKEIRKILNEKVPVKKNMLESAFGGILGLFTLIIDSITGLFGIEPISSAEEAADPFKILNLKPRERKQIDKIQEKISKGGFECKVRMIYWAKKDLMNKGKVVNGFVGYMKQFADLDINNLKPDTKVTATTVNYFFVNYRLNERKRKIVSGYRYRSIWSGRFPGILNIEELATLWHFPIEGVTAAPLLIKAPGRKAVPPSSLPLEELAAEEEAVIEDIFLEERKPRTEPVRMRESASKEEEFEEAKRELEEDIFAQQESKSQAVESGSRGAPPSNLPFA